MSSKDTHSANEYFHVCMQFWKNEKLRTSPDINETALDSLADLFFSCFQLSELQASVAKFEIWMSLIHAGSIAEDKEPLSKSEFQDCDAKKCATRVEQFFTIAKEQEYFTMKLKDWKTQHWILALEDAQSSNVKPTKTKKRTRAPQAGSIEELQMIVISLHHTVTGIGSTLMAMHSTLTAIGNAIVEQSHHQLDFSKMLKLQTTVFKEFADEVAIMSNKISTLPENTSVSEKKVDNVVE